MSEGALRHWQAIFFTQHTIEIDMPAPMPAAHLQGVVSLQEGHELHDAARGQAGFFRETIG